MTATVKRRLSGFCNPGNPRTAAYDPHQRCPGCDCRAAGCPCNPGDPVTSNPADSTASLTPTEAWGVTLDPPASLPVTVQVVEAAVHRLHQRSRAADVSTLDWPDAVRLIRDLTRVRNQITDTIDALTKHVYLTGPHGEAEVDGVGVIRVTRGQDRKAWDGLGLSRAIIDAHMEAEGLEEPPDPFTVAEWLLAGFSVGYGRVTVLRALGIPPDEFCDTTPGRPKVSLPRQV